MRGGQSNREKDIPASVSWTLQQVVQTAIVFVVQPPTNFYDGIFMSIDTGAK
jgi:hypothetical protein